MKEKGSHSICVEKWKPYFAMICLQFGYAGMNIVTKVALNAGMSHFVLVVYRQAFATAVVAPFAFVLERGERPKMTFPIFMQIFVLGLLGPVVDQNLYYMGLKFTSPTFSCAMSNMLPAFTFFLAVLSRMEKVEIKKLRWQAKVVGTFVTVAGAMLMTLYKGYVINLVWFGHFSPTHAASSAASVDNDWINGSIFLILATLAWAAFFIIQAITVRRYTAPLSLTALVCFMGTLQSMAVTFVMEHKPSVWSIGWDMNLLAAAYAGIISSAIAYYVQSLVMEQRGLVFVTGFSPLMMIIVAFMSSFILAEKIYVGSALGAGLIVMGSYSVLWAKNKKEDKEEMLEVEAMKVDENYNNTSNQLATIKEELETEDIESQMNEAYKTPALAISFPMPHPPMIAMEAPMRQTT